MKCRATKDGKLISFGKTYINNPDTIQVNDITFAKVNNFVYKNEQYELFFSMAKKAFITQVGIIRNINYYRYLQVTKLSSNEIYYYKATSDDLSQFEGQADTPFTETINVTTPMFFVFETLDNYAEDVDALVESLRQRLSVIKGELWYQINYGIPLFEKYKNKSFMDAAILGIINGHPAVASIISFQSTVKGTNYTFNCRIMSIYSEEISLDNNYTI